MKRKKRINNFKDKQLQEKYVMERKLVNYNIVINKYFQILNKQVKNYHMLEELNNLLKIDSNLFIDVEYLNLETLKYMQIVQNILKVKLGLEVTNDLFNLI